MHMKYTLDFFREEVIKPYLNGVREILV